MRQFIINYITQKPSVEDMMAGQLYAILGDIKQNFILSESSDTYHTLPMKLVDIIEHYNAWCMIEDDIDTSLSVDTDDYEDDDYEDDDDGYEDDTHFTIKQVIDLYNIGYSVDDIVHMV